MTAELVAAALFVGVVAYALFGGADYGAGLWDLMAGTGEAADGIRRQIDRSLGPVWEANHVWLIYILVMLWTGFPRAFSAIMTTLAVPWALAGLGIVFRGGAFVFRKSSSTYAQARLHGLVFAASSVITPFFLGTIAGAIAAGRVPLDGGDVLASWTGPLSIVGGFLAVLTTAFLAAVLLASDAARRGDVERSAWFRSRALVAGAVTGVAALVAAATIELTADDLAGGLHGRAAPLVVVSAVAGSASLWWLWSNQLARARIAAAVAVASIVAGWGVAQYPWVLVGQATIDETAGATATLQALLGVTVAAVVLVLPALVWLYRLADRPDWN